MPPTAMLRSFVLTMIASILLASAAHAQKDQPPAGETKPVPKFEQTISPVKMKRVYPSLVFPRPVWLTHAGDDSGRLFLVQQSGKIHVLPKDQDSDKTKTFLDISSKVLSYASGGHNEEGMLCLAFHPDYRKNGYCYIYYNASKPRRSVISRFSVSKDDPDVLDPASEKVILEVEQPFGNHKGCCMLFGADGYLYLSLGDGGLAYDPYYNGQNLDTLLAKLLRIDVNKEENGKAYAIPADNPFVGKEGARPEIYAYGLRNVWRMCFDRKTGLLYAGDVGQDKLEEIDLITRGGNYGWSLREASIEVPPGQATKLRKDRHIDSPMPAGMSSPGSMIEPIAEYGRKEGYSVTGGYVYRGRRLKNLEGVYIYADYASGRFWGLKYENSKVVANNVILKQPKNISSFGEGPDGELYILTDEGRDYREGAIYVLEESQPDRPAAP